MKNNYTHPKFQKEITAITLFSGTGGGTLGLQYNHIKEVLAVDNWGVAEKAFKANFPEIPFWNADLSKISGADILEKTGTPAGQLDILLASPPCQGFSQASGKFNPLDPRNALFLNTIDIIKGVLPKCFIIENVPGMLHDRMAPIWNEILYRFQEKLMPHYEMKCFKLNSLFYHTPQKRQRLIFIAYKRGLNVIPTPPAPDFADVDCLKIKDIAPEITAIKVGQSVKTFKHNTKHLTTVTASDALTVYSNGKEGALTEDQDRRFATFPEWYKVPSEISKSDRHRLFGNTIPPMFMQAIVGHILDEIGDKL